MAAKIRVVRVIKIVGHPCKACELGNPPIVFEGIVADTRIQWPTLANYRITYCPHCGEELPRKYPVGKE